MKLECKLVLYLFVFCPVIAFEMTYTKKYRFYLLQALMRWKETRF